MTLPFLYQNVTPINRDQHRNKRLKPVTAPLAYAAKEYIFPALMPEFVAACRELPIFFAATPQGPSPIFMAGPGPEKNVFIRADGIWAGSYVPAYLRRYPFIAGDVPNSEAIVCIDTTWPGLQDEEGEALFTDADEPTPLLANAIRIVSDYSVAAAASIAFVTRLQELDLFKAVSIDVQSADGSKSSFHGLLAVDEEKLRLLGDEEFASLRKAGYLPAVYAHLISLGNLPKLSAGPAS